MCFIHSPLQHGRDPIWITGGLEFCFPEGEMRRSIGGQIKADIRGQDRVPLVIFVTLENHFFQD